MWGLGLDQYLHIYICFLKLAFASRIHLGIKLSTKRKIIQATVHSHKSLKIINYYIKAPEQTFTTPNAIYIRINIYYIFPLYAIAIYKIYQHTYTDISIGCLSYIVTLIEDCSRNHNIPLFKSIRIYEKKSSHSTLEFFHCESIDTNQPNIIQIRERERERVWWGKCSLPCDGLAHNATAIALGNHIWHMMSV